MSPPAPAPAAGLTAPEFGSVAIVHDYLNQPGGAERVVLAMAGIWPDAPIYTSLYRADSTFPAFGAANVHISGLHWLPIDRGFRNLFPLYPAAFRSFGPLDHDVVISSSSGWAHMVHTAPQTFHAVYCHAPARWLYESMHLADVRSRSLRPFKSLLRGYDRHAARRAHLYIANSAEVAGRIRDYYGISDVCFSLPAVLNSRGVDRVLRIELDEPEVTGLRRSAEVLKSTIARIGF